MESKAGSRVENWDADGEEILRDAEDAEALAGFRFMYLARPDVDGAIAEESMVEDFIIELCGQAC